MTTYSYEERRDVLALKSSILVQVLLGAAPGDVEFVALPTTEEKREELRRQWPGRGLRHVGFIGLVDGAPQLVSKELLDATQIQALAVAFGVYVANLVTSAATHGYLAVEIERAEGAELEREHMERICALPDPRTEYGPN